MTWKPTTLTRFVKAFPSSGHTALVETDAGLGYVKAMGGSEGLHTLAAEVVGTQLASWFGLSTFDWAIIEIDEIDEIPFHDKNGNKVGQAVPGPAFITRAEQGTQWSGGDRELKLLVNPQDISRLVVFDTWVLNCDRRGPTDPVTNRCRKPNTDNVFLSAEAPAGEFLLKAIDHTYCFTCGREWTRKLSQVDIIRDSRVFGLFPEFRACLDRPTVVQAATHLTRITPADVAAMIQQIPREWGVSSEARTALVELVVGWAAYVADTIEAQLWPQRVFPEDETEASER